MVGMEIFDFDKGNVKERPFNLGKRSCCFMIIIIGGKD